MTPPIPAPSDSHAEIFSAVVTDFSLLFAAQPDDGWLRINTPFVTLSSSFVTVFVKQDGDKYLISDNGWLGDDTYYTGPIDIASPRIAELRERFNMGEPGYYDEFQYWSSTAESLELLSARVFDMANFIAAVVNLSLFYSKP